MQLTEWKAFFKADKKHTRFTAVLGIVGLILVLASSCWADMAKEQPTASKLSEEAYRTQLEQRMEKLISQLEGAGRTSVMLTLESGEETVYALDIQEGESRSEQSHVLLKDGTALSELTRQPQVRGVAVLCEGGDRPAVAARIIELSAALFDLPTNRICVAKRAG